MMSFPKFFFFFSCLLSFYTCKKQDKLVSFNLSTNNQIQIPAYPDSLLNDKNPSNDQLNILSDEIRFSNMSKFAENHTDHTEVMDVQALDLTISIDSGATDFTFGKNFVFYISPSGQYFNDLILASIPSAQNEIKSFTFSMSPSKTQWLDLFNKGIYHLRLSCDMLDGISKPVFVSYKMSFRLKAMRLD